MKYVKVLVCILLVFVVTFNVTSVYCASFFDDIIGEGKNFFQPGSGSEGNVGNIGASIENTINTQIEPIIETVGTLIFYVVAAILGLKYIWSSVEGKTQVKETLPTFLVAAGAFFLADTIYKFSKGLITDVLSGSNYTTMSNNLWGSIIYVVNIFAIAGVAALGLKYMFASADTRADVKKDLIPVVIGLLLIYSITNILTLLVKAGGQIIP